MGGTGVIDRFLEVFTRYIDSGFGLLHGEVAFIATTLIVIDVTLAALFWTLGEGDDIIARLIKKTLFVGIFAYIIGNWNALARIVFESFAGLGLKASGTGFTAAELLQPGRVAQVGLDAGRPILESISGLMGYISFFENFIQIVVLLFAWVVVLLAFFVLAVQLFVTLVEFKLTVLCGFVLIPFGLFGKTAFMAERVLGHVVSSGIKVLVLAVIVGIGSTLFSEFTDAVGNAQPTIEDAMAIVLGALCLLGLGIFGPGIASGIVSGGPQLGAGAAAGTALAAGSVVAAGAAAGGAALSAAGGALAGTARTVGSAASAYRVGAEGKSGLGGVAAGLGSVGRAAAERAPSPLRGSSNQASPGSAGSGAGRSSSGAAPDQTASAPIAVGSTAAAEPHADSTPAGSDMGDAPVAHPSPQHGETSSAQPDTSPEPVADPASAAAGGPPAWARAMRRNQAIVHGASVATHTLRGGDSRGPGASVSITDKE
ncbi:P-type conjugative transfer protein TrbL [Sphingomonas sp. HF-S4]|uniref:P-type conjugative transfer protein TrbL n=2 Tax=Sphingomonas TaxID=13687 RepID=A0A4U1L5B5_9SPHN|nr:MULTISPECIES: P-type conjugative transfer protein TrbL [Sphingomonas]MDV3458240.1 P-type conjugative transfer protein TrbL [Sphingomonas sp. HF-S4]TKD51460.1 P-type conjugative transfer protein TrbL [Sphingomonas baiyangensis]